jgi:nucleoside-diphosphate-sugar epimerase
MLVLVTGAAGLIGSHVMVALLKEGHSILATDINELPSVVTDQIEAYLDRVMVITGDLCDVTFIDQLFDAAPSPIEGIMHIGGIRSPVGLDPRLVHSINVVAAYNVMQTAAARGVRRMVQASSCNALGLSWTMPEHWGLDFVPINETHPMRPVSQSISQGDTTDIRKEDPYSLSKL